MKNAAETLDSLVAVLDAHRATLSKTNPCALLRELACLNCDGSGYNGECSTPFVDAGAEQSPIAT